MHIKWTYITYYAKNCNPMFTRLYLHIPFCRAKCGYCAFTSRTAGQEAIDDYQETLLQELHLAANAHGTGAGIDSIYLGGGTPSLLHPHQVARLLETCARLFFLKEPEITIEANPGTVDRERLAGYRRAGVNRLSLGVQSFDDTMLSGLGRIHTATQALGAIAAARGAGFDNLGLDLIHSLPGQTLDTWRRELEQAVECGPEHLSVYGLTIEEGTPFALRYPDRHPVDEEVSAAMYELADDLLTTAGYEHYEIANYARPGFRSRHNSGYWKRDGYLGLGAGAHSFLTLPPWGTRLASSDDRDRYTEAVRSGRLPYYEEQHLTREDAIAEFFFLGLRMTEGVRLDEFRERFGCSVDEHYPGTVEPLAKAGLVTVDAERLRLTRDGMLLSNQVFSRFLP